MGLRLLGGIVHETVVSILLTPYHQLSTMWISHSVEGRLKVLVKMCAENARLYRSPCSVLLLPLGHPDGSDSLPKRVGVVDHTRLWGSGGHALQPTLNPLGIPSE